MYQLYCYIEIEIEISLLTKSAPRGHIQLTITIDTQQYIKPNIYGSRICGNFLHTNYGDKAKRRNLRRISEKEKSRNDYM